MDKYLGHEMSFWIELKRRAEENNMTANLDEIVELRGKLNFYESRIKEMAKFVN